MIAYPLYSEQKVSDALASIGETRLGDSVPALLRQILLSLCGGDISMIGATGIASMSPSLTKQIFIASVA